MASAVCITESRLIATRQTIRLLNIIWETTVILSSCLSPTWNSRVLIGDAIADLQPQSDRTAGA